MEDRFCEACYGYGILWIDHEIGYTACPECDTGQAQRDWSYKRLLKRQPPEFDTRKDSTGVHASFRSGANL